MFEIDQNIKRCDATKLKCLKLTHFFRSRSFEIDAFFSVPDLYGDLSRNDLISLTLSYDEKVKALTEEVCVLQKEMNQAR